MRIEKTFEYEEKDLIRFGFDTYLSRRGLFLFIISGVFIICLAALILISDNLGHMEMYMMFLFLTIMLVFPIVIYFQMRRSYRTSQFFKDEQSFVFEESGVSGKTSIGESKINWNKFHKFIFFKSTIALYASARQAYIFPRRIFDQDEIDEIRTFLTSDEELKKKTKVYKQ